MRRAVAGALLAIVAVAGCGREPNDTDRLRAALRRGGVADEDVDCMAGQMIRLGITRDQIAELERYRPGDVRPSAIDLASTASEVCNLTTVAPLEP